MQELVFITRGACGSTPSMKANLDAALQALRLPTDYIVVDLDTVPRTDVRAGYPIPTLLYGNRDLFGMADPVPPFPEPS